LHPFFGGVTHGILQGGALMIVRTVQKDLKIPTVKHEISRYSYNYSKRLSVHPKELILNLKEPPETRRLRKNLPIDIPTRLKTEML
jgi:hypothetical protein